MRVNTWGGITRILLLQSHNKPTMTVTLTILKCHAVRRDGEVCGHRWIPRISNPNMCPKCKSPKWSKPCLKKQNP